MILLNNTDSLIRRYSETVRIIHTMLSQLNTSSNQRGFNMYCISYIKSMLLQLQCNNAFQSKKEQPFTMLPTGVFIDSTDALMAFRRFNSLFANIATCDLVANATCDLVANATCDLVADATCDPAFETMKVVAQLRFLERRLSCL